MLTRPSTPYWGTVLDAPDAGELAHFYSRLLGWKIHKEEPGWVTIAAPQEGVYLGFSSNAEYQRPVWPSTKDHQQMMLHLDIEVTDLEADVAYAISCGAVLHDFQPQERVRVLLDPAGHPFCLYVD